MRKGLLSFLLLNSRVSFKLKLFFYKEHELDLFAPEDCHHPAVIFYINISEKSLQNLFSSILRKGLSDLLGMSEWEWASENDYRREKGKISEFEKEILGSSDLVMRKIHKFKVVYLCETATEMLVYSSLYQDTTKNYRNRVTTEIT